MCTLHVMISTLNAMSNQVTIDIEEYNRLKKAEKELASLKTNEKRLCKQNPYRSSLSMDFDELSIKTDNWLANETEITKDIVLRSKGEHNHIRFDAFEEFGNCNYTCVGGGCKGDRSKIINNDIASNPKNAEPHKNRFT